MQEKQSEFLKSLVADAQAFKDANPELTRHYQAMNAEAYAPGSLDAKTKRLMALCAALAADCPGCVVYQCGLALDLGADRDEIMEACAVAVSLGGTMASCGVARVMRFLDERLDR